MPVTVVTLSLDARATGEDRSKHYHLRDGKLAMPVVRRQFFQTAHVAGLAHNGHVLGLRRGPVHRDVLLPADTLPIVGMVDRTRPVNQLVVP